MHVDSTVVVQSHDTHVAFAAMLTANRPLDFTRGTKRLTDHFLALNAVLVGLSTARIETLYTREKAMRIHRSARIRGAEKHPARKNKTSEKKERG